MGRLNGPVRATDEPHGVVLLRQRKRDGAGVVSTVISSVVKQRCEDELSTG